MPETDVVLFVGADGTCPLLQWLDGLPPKVQDKCIVRVERLAERGYQLRRPEADFIRDGIYELRASYQRVHYRMLYFFHGKVAVVSHGLIKEKQVPVRDVELAIKRKIVFTADPETHTCKG